ncbi:MAG: hypothetical protein U9Q07_03775 [Planctomycetota bacterium]|nr:hypothetical protein [Planctomycetota bacterium]
MSLSDNPFWCEKHGFTNVVTAEGTAEVPANKCPFCRFEVAEAELVALKEQLDKLHSLAADDRISDEHLGARVRAGIEEKAGNQ